MKRIVLALAAFGLIASLALPLQSYRAANPPENPAPAKAADFTLVDSHGKRHKLSDYAGKYIVLEWYNHGCPFVKKHYNSGNMQALQKKYTEKGVVWLSIISSAPGKEGHCTPEQANELMTKMKSSPTAILIDEDGTVGKLYGARTTPHMFVIDPAQTKIYEGAIDSRRSADPADIPGATNYVDQALTEAMSGKPVTVAAMQPYGCSVKY